MKPSKDRLHTGRRRSAAAGMIRIRANPAHVKDLLGHKDFASLDAYVRLEIQDLKEAHRQFHPRERDEAVESSPDGAGGAAPDPR